jgi:DnaJ-domain-containing protein 1
LLVIADLADSGPKCAARQQQFRREASMFERGRIDTRPEPVAVPVELELLGGEVEKGKLILLASQAPLDAINQPGGFVEFVPYAGEPRLVAKATIASVRLVGVPRAPALRGRHGMTDDFEPYTILGLPDGSPFEAVRNAYIELSKTYHPDRYSSAALPPEVVGYLETMARRVNAAYAALEATERTAKRYRADLMPAVYTSRARL